MEETTYQPEAVPSIESQPTPPAKSKKSDVWEFVRFAATVIVVVVGVRMFIAQPFVVSGTSMVPTFENKDYLIIDEISYRFNKPERGDVIVFHPPVDSATYYVKRIIGVPGDTVSITQSVVSITNAEHPDGMTLTEPYITPDAEHSNYSVTVPEGQYFTMGDNRPASFDSRKWGLLPEEKIIGRVFLRLYPFSEIGVFPGKVEIN